MHMLIGVLVFSKTEEKAIKKARDIVDNLTGDDKPFDYSTFFTPEEDSPSSGASRYGNRKPAMLVDSLEGRELTEKLLGYTKQELFENLEKVRSGLSVLTPEDVWNGTSKTERSSNPASKENHIEYGPGMFRYYCREVGQYKGSSIFLYDQDGEGIRDQQHYDNVMDKWELLYKDESENPYKDLDLYIVPVDVHF